MIELPIYNKILVLLIDIIAAWLVFFVYQEGPKKKLNRIFIFMAASMFIWVNFAYLARIIGRDQIYLSLLFLKIAWFVTPLFFTFLYLLVIHTIKKEKKYNLLTNAVLFAGIGLAIITSFTNLIVDGVNFTNGNLEIIYGGGIGIFLGIGLFLICATLYPLFKNYFKLSPKTKQKIQFFFIGIFIFYLGNTIFNIILPVFFGIFHFYYIGDYSTIFLLGFTSYAIVKEELFGTKVILTGLLVALIAILLLLDTLVFTSQLWLQIIKGGIFLVFLYFGYLLIKSVLLEIKRREKMEKLTTELQVAHIKLEAAYKQLEKLDKAKSEFISIASHQLRTPLTAINGYVSLVLGGSYGKLPEKSRKPIENIYSSSQRLIRLINDLLSISRIEAGKIKVEPEKVSLEDLISGIIDELKIAADKKNLSLELKIPEEHLPEILLDKDKIRQAVLNIIDNAIKYTKKGSVLVRIEKEKSKVIIIVSDTGEGMTEQELSSVFASFSRGMAGMQLHTKGTGLGLNIAKRFIEMHKGKIWAKSNGRGEGSTFFIELPIR